MISKKQVQTSTGPVEMPFVQFAMNPAQIAMIVGLPSYLLPQCLTYLSNQGEWVSAGRLSNVSPPMYPALIDSLNEVGWDFTTHADPVLMIGTIIDRVDMPDEDYFSALLKPGIDQQAEPTGDPGLMTEMGQVIRDNTVLPDASFKQQTEHLAAEYMGEQDHPIPVTSDTLALSAATGAYLDDLLQEAELLMMADTDRERMLIYALIVANWVTHYRTKSTRLDHEPAYIAPELFAQGIQTQPQFDAFLALLCATSDQPAQ